MSQDLTVPLNFNTCEEVHTTEAQGVGRNQGYVHLWKEENKKREVNNKKCPHSINQEKEASPS